MQYAAVVVLSVAALTDMLYTLHLTLHALLTQYRRLQGDARCAAIAQSGRHYAINTAVTSEGQHAIATIVSHCQNSLKQLRQHVATSMACQAVGNNSHSRKHSDSKDTSSITETTTSVTDDDADVLAVLDTSALTGNLATAATTTAVTTAAAAAAPTQSTDNSTQFECLNLALPNCATSSDAVTGRAIVSKKHAVKTQLSRLLLVTDKTHKPDRSGYLLFRDASTSSASKWQRRWFELRKPLLMMCRTMSEANCLPLATLVLHDISGNTNSSNSSSKNSSKVKLVINEKALELQLSAVGGDWLLQAGSYEDLQQWAYALSITNTTVI
jgi:PH domain